MAPLRVLDFGLATLGLVLTYRLLNRRRTAPLPPGPPGYPIIGNLLDWPKEHGWKVFAQLGQTYGDIMHFNLLGKHIIVLNSPQLAIDMLDRKGLIYADRPSMFFTSELAGWKLSVGMTPYGERHRRMRTLLGREIGTRAAVERFAAMAQAENARFLRKVLADPRAETLQGHIRHMVAAVILNIAYGYQILEKDDPWLALSERVARDMIKMAQPGAYLVDIIPALNRLPNWFPGTGFKKDAAEMRAAKFSAVSGPYEYVLGQLAAGTARPSLVANAIDGIEVTPAHESEVQYAAAALYDAGSDTTISVLYNFFLAMTLYPEVQQRARAELDSVVGPDRLPTVSDRDRLPFINAVQKEVLRWGSTAPLGVPHTAREDDVHAGFFIPKGAYVVPNIWGFTHDARTYREPLVFDPGRFLGEAGRAVEPDPRAYVFGFGRRVCPGADLADTSTFITLAMVLATLDISRARDASGDEIVPSGEYQSGLVTHPKPFVCLIKARSPNAEALVTAGADES